MEKQTQYTQNLEVLGNTPRKSRFDENLARQVNEEVEREEKLEELRKKTEARKGKAKEEAQPETPEVKGEPIIILSNLALEDFILLKGRTHETHSYPDLLVSMYRLSATPEVIQAANNLGFQAANTAKEANGRDYIGNINWKQALSLNLGLGGLTLNTRQFADFLLVLKSGNAVDGTGRKVQKSKLDEILNEITEVRSPYRAEWLDADFKYLNEKLWLYSAHQTKAGNLDANYKKELEDCLMVKGSRINFATINVQGMPIEQGNDFYYRCPDKDNKSVAGFYAVSDRAFLSCDRYPTDPIPSLGVRGVCEANAQKI